MYNAPERFREFVAKCACICFTATPDDQEKDSMDTKLLTAMQFKQFNYITNKAEQKLVLTFNEQRVETILADKTAVVKADSQNGPVLVYCDDKFYEELKQHELELLVVDDNVDHQELRTLDQRVNGKFRVVVATTMTAMRGIDYRSENAKMTLIVAKSFANKREAMQGYCRVGRFGD